MQIPEKSNVLGVIILLGSLSLNFYILRILSKKPQPIVQCPTFLQQVIPETPFSLDGFPRHLNSSLTHLMVTVDDELEQLFSSWSQFPPCLLGSQPTSWSQAHVHLSFLVPQTNGSLPIVANSARESFKKLPTTVKACFKSFSIFHFSEGTVSPWSVAPFLKQNKDHLAWISSKCRPVQENWLNHLDNQCRPPNEPFWMKASIPRGPIDNLPEAKKDPSSVLRLSPNAILNLADQEFASFYASLKKEKSWELPIFKHLDQLGSKPPFFTHIHHLKSSNTILDMGNHTDYDEYELLTEEPDIVLLCHY